MPHMMPKSPNSRKKAFDPVVAPRILPRHSDEELEARRAARAEVTSRQAARDHLLGEPPRSSAAYRDASCLDQRQRLRSGRGFRQAPDDPREQGALEELPKHPRQR